MDGMAPENRIRLDSIGAMGGLLEHNTLIANKAIECTQVSTDLTKSPSGIDKEKVKKVFVGRTVTGSMKE